MEGSPNPFVAIASVPPEPVNILTDNFSSSAGWTLQDYWQITGGKLQYADPFEESNRLATKNLGALLEDGETYRVRFTCEDIYAYDCEVYLGGNDSSKITISDGGNFDQNLVAGADQKVYIRFSGNGDDAVSVFDNLIIDTVV